MTPFDGGPAHPCTLEEIEKCGISQRTLIAAHIAQAAPWFAITAMGELQHKPEQLAHLVAVATDALMDELEIKP